MGLTTLCFCSAEHCSPSASRGLFATRSTTAVKSAGPCLARSASSSLLFVAFILYGGRQIPASENALRAGQPAPQFTWADTADQLVSSSELLKNHSTLLLVFCEVTGDRFATPSYGVSSSASASFMTVESKYWRLASTPGKSHKNSAKPRGASHSCLIQVRRSSANTECCIQAPEKSAKTSRGPPNFLWTAVV
jgi:hypothetical protein